METIKRNIGLTIFGGLALVALVILGVMTRSHAGRVAEYEAKVQEQRDYIERVGRGIKRAEAEGEKVKTFAVTAENLALARADLAITDQKLAQLKRELSERAQIVVPAYSGVECKNILRRDTNLLRQQLARRQVLVDDNAINFSFGPILSADTLPDEEREVPVIMKQLEVVKEIVQLIGAANKGNLRLVKIQREQGLATGKLDLYEVTPFALTLVGDLESTREFLTRLQRDAKYLFVLKYSSLKSSDPVDGLVGGRGDMTPMGAPGPGGPMMPPGAMGFEGMGRMMPPRPTAEADEDATPAPPKGREERVLTFDDLVQTEILFDFIEFSTPAEEN